MNTFGIELVDVESEGRDRDEDGWESDRWTVTLSRGQGPYRFPYRKGLGHNGTEPTLDEVLEALASDCGIVENDEIDDVMGDMPYSKAHKIVTALNAEVVKVRRLLGDDYEAFWTQERE